MKEKKIFGYAKKIYHYWLFSLFRHGVVLIIRHFVQYPLRRKEFNRLKQFKNKHKGKRCFIIATAPSLTLDDVNLLKNEYTFSMNSCYKLFDKTDWRPTYYCLADKYVYDRIKEELDVDQFNCAFLTSLINIKSPNIFRLPIIMNWANNSVERKRLSKKFQIKKFSFDISKKCYMGTSVVHSIMQICFYMGFKEIYLLGADCDFTSAIKHSKLVSYKGSNKLENPPEEIFEGLMGDYLLAKEEAGKHGIRIFNATRGGKLELFERVSLDQMTFNK